MRARDEGVQNTHRKHDIVTSRYWWLLGITVATVASILLLSWQQPLTMRSSSPLADGATEPATWIMWIYAFLFGSLGAVVSSGLGLARLSVEGRIPTVKITTMQGLFRPIFGGAAAVGALALLAAGLISGLDTTNGTLVGVAFVAGFSERLIDKAASRFSSTETPPASI